MESSFGETEQLANKLNKPVFHLKVAFRCFSFISVLRQNAEDSLGWSEDTFWPKRRFFPQSSAVSRRAWSWCHCLPKGTTVGKLEKTRFAMTGPHSQGQFSDGVLRRLRSEALPGGPSQPCIVSCMSLLRDACRCFGLSVNGVPTKNKSLYLPFVCGFFRKSTELRHSVAR